MNSFILITSESPYETVSYESPYEWITLCGGIPYEWIPL